jgi:hypothetical protein
MVLVLPTAAAVQPLAEAVVVQQLAPPAARAVAQEVPRVLEAWVAQPKAAGVARAEQDAAAEPQPGAASDAEVPLPEAAAVPDVAAEAPRRVAEQVSVGAVLLPGAAPVAEVQPRAVRDEQGVRPSAAAWAAAPSIRLRADRLAPSLPARTAHAKARLRIAQP